MIRVALSLGIGDNCWAATKFKAFRDCVQDDIEFCINKSPYHKTLPLLDMMPYSKKNTETDLAPRYLEEFMKPYRSTRWSSLWGSENWKGFDYVLIPLPHLERGERIETWLPELETDFYWAKDLKITKQSTHPNRVLLYPSGHNANTGFHANWWKAKDWQQVINLLNQAGIRPVIVGSDSESDLTYFKQANFQGDFDDMVGKTSIEEYAALIKEAKIWVGLNSGGGILSAYLGTPTLMFWSDQRFKTGGVLLNPKQQTNWLCKEQLSTYKTMSFGSPEMTPENIVKGILSAL